MSVAQERLTAEMNSAGATALLQKLQALPLVCNVSTKPMKPASKPNHFGVSFRLKVPGSITLQKRMAVTDADGARPTFCAAVEAALHFANDVHAEQGVHVSTASPPSTEELEWLASWIDEQLAPEAVTVAEADAALSAHRLLQAGSSQAGSSQANLASASTGYMRLQVY